MTMLLDGVVIVPPLLDDLPALQHRPGGAAWLASQGVHLDPAGFVAALRPPASPVVGDGSGRPLVWVGQQASLDQPASVVAKFAALRDVLGHGGVAGAFVALDTDRAGSDPGLLQVRLGHGRVLRLAPQRHTSRELRAVALTADRWASVAATLRQWIDEDAAARPDAPTDPATRHDRLQRLLTAVETATGLDAGDPGAGEAPLPDVAVAVTTHLLREDVRLDIPAVRASALLASGALDRPVTALVAQWDTVVRVWNDTVDRLRADGIDPAVGHRRPDDLPLHLSCPNDDRRLRLTRHTQGRTHLATATCPCGATHRIHLGHGSEISLAELHVAGRWSTDVTFPITMEPGTSGTVVGRSSARYGLVLGRVIRDVLGTEPNPVLVPPVLPTAGPSLLARHLGFA